MTEQKPLIQGSDFWATPESSDALWDSLANYSGGERVAAMTAAGMAINLCAKVIAEANGDDYAPTPFVTFTQSETIDDE